MNIVRSLGVFLLNVLLAVGVPPLAAHPVSRYLVFHSSMWGNILFESALSSLVALVFGYTLNLAWNRDEMKWIWLAGAAWCGVGILRALQEAGSVLDVSETYNLLGGISRRDIQVIAIWSGFILPFIRTVF